MIKYLAIILGSVVALGALGIVLLQISAQPINFDQQVNVPLPPAIGGRLPIQVRSGVLIRPLTLELAVTMTMSIDDAALSQVLPIEDFSILVDQPEHPEIVSMLGRINFVADSVRVRAAERTLEVSAMMEGEFYVRPRRAYRRDEEQTETGDIRTFVGRVDVVIDNLAIQPDWKLRFEPPAASFEVNSLTKVAWQDAYGPGAGFTELIQRLLAERATTFLIDIGIAERDLRSPLLQAAQKFDQQLSELEENLPGWLRWPRKLKIVSLAIDNCPTQTAPGTVMLSLGMRLDFSGAPGSLTKLPNLQIADGPCG